MPIVDDLKKAENWLNENGEKIAKLGENGEKICNSIQDMLNGAEQGLYVNLTGYSDVDEILKQAGGIDELIKSHGIDLGGLLYTVQIVVKSALLAATLF